MISDNELGIKAAKVRWLKHLCRMHRQGISRSVTFRRQAYRTQWKKICTYEALEIE
jgi:hypothetical protein